MKDLILYSDEELMQEIKADNMFAFDALYKKYCKRVYKFGYSILKYRKRQRTLFRMFFLIYGRIATKLKKTHQLNPIYSL